MSLTSTGEQDFLQSYQRTSSVDTPGSWRSEIKKLLASGEHQGHDMNVTSFARQETSSADSLLRPTEIQKERVDAILRLLEKNRPSVPHEIRVSGMQKWEGRVLEADQEIFTAELAPLSHDGILVAGDFDQNQLGEDRFAAPGDVVYVTVRTVQGPSGHPHRTAAVRLRRLGRWSTEDVDRHTASARMMRERILGLID